MDEHERKKYEDATRNAEEMKYMAYGGFRAIFVSLVGLAILIFVITRTDILLSWYDNIIVLQ